MKFINKTRLFCFVLFWTLAISFVLSYFDTAKADIRESVVRLHIIANSNSDADQSVKLKVRDRILKDGKNIFSSSKTSAETLCLLNENKAYIEKIAEDELLKNGFSDKVSVNVGEFSFPQKNYSKFSFPSGTYNAVRVEIGDARGKNWWCVMYPPLCFVQGVAKIPEEADAIMQKNLSDSEYALLADGESGVEIRFKLLEIIESLL